MSRNLYHFKKIKTKKMKIEDKVIILSIQKISRYSTGGIKFVDNMQKYIGKRANIVMMQDGSIFLDIDNQDWVWSDEWLELLPDQKQ